MCIFLQVGMILYSHQENAMTATRNMSKAWMMPWMNSMKMAKCIKTKKNVA